MASAIEPRRSAPRLEARWRTTTNGDPSRAGKRGRPAQRCSDCSEAQHDGRRTCAHLRGTALAVGSVPAGRRSVSGSSRGGGINPNRCSRPCAHRLAVCPARRHGPRDLTRARLRARWGAKNAGCNLFGWPSESCGWGESKSIPCRPLRLATAALRSAPSPKPSTLPDPPPSIAEGLPGR